VKIAILIPGGICLRRETKILAELGHVCRRFSFTSTFIASVAIEDFDLVIVSWRLSGPRTVDIVQDLRRSHGEGLPIILLDPPVAAMDSEYLSQLGVDACYRQEQDPGRLVRCVEQAMSQTQSRQQVQVENEEEAKVPALLTLVS
jgi:DNA-binding response OmpR family regulator